MHDYGGNWLHGLSGATAVLRYMAGGLASALDLTGCRLQLLDRILIGLRDKSSLGFVIEAESSVVPTEYIGPSLQDNSQIYGANSWDAALAPSVSMRKFR
jgi:hypothetical protein